MENIVSATLPLFHTIAQKHDIVANLHNRVHIVAVHDCANIILSRNILYQLVNYQTRLRVQSRVGLVAEQILRIQRNRSGMFTRCKQKRALAIISSWLICENISSGYITFSCTVMLSNNAAP